MGKLGKFILKVAAVVILIGGGVVVGFSMITGETRNGNGTQGEVDYLITVGLSQSGKDTLWKKANTESFTDTFVEENGYRLVLSDAGEDQEKQFSDIESFIKQDVDYIILNPVVETGWKEILEKARDARIPVMLINNRIDEEDASLYRCWIGNDYEKQTLDAGKWLVKYLKSEGREKDHIAMATIQGSIGTAEQLAHAEGYRSIFDKHPNWNMRAQQTGEGSREEGKKVMELFLEHYPDLEVVFAESDEMALGAVEAMNEAGKSCGPDGDIILISFGGSKEGLQAILDENLNVTFEQNPNQAPKAAELIQRLDSGIAIDREQYMVGTYYDNTMELEAVIEKRSY